MRIYIAGPPEEGDEYAEIKTRLEAKGHDVLCNPENRDLVTAISDLLDCDAICLMEIWWSALQATQLQTVASWIGLKHVDVMGDPLPTGGLR